MLASAVPGNIDDDAGRSVSVAVVRYHEPICIFMEYALNAQSMIEQVIAMVGVILEVCRDDKSEHGDDGFPTKDVGAYEDTTT